MKKVLMLRALAIAAVGGLGFGVIAPNKIMAQDADSPSPTAPAVSPSDVPVFDRGAFIDASGTGGFIKMEFINMSTAAPFTLSVYGWDDRSAQWVFCGTAFLKDYRADDAIAHTPQARFVGSYRYFGVESTAASPLAFSRSMLAKGNRVCITITNGDTSFASTTPAVVATVPAAPPPPAPATAQVASADFAGTVVDVGFTAIFDEMEFTDYTRTGPHSLRVYAYDDRTEQWIYCGPIYLRRYGDKDGIDVDHMFYVSSYRYLGVEAEEGASLKYSIEPTKKRDKVRVAVME